MEIVGTRVEIVTALDSSMTFREKINKCIESLENVGKSIVSIDTTMAKSKYSTTYMATIKYY